MTLVATELANPGRALYVALDLGAEKWKVASSVGLGQAPRFRTMAARDLAGLAAEITLAKARFGLACDAEVFSCYEAGRDGFWLHRALTAMSVVNTVVDSSSIEVPRRKRRAKTDKLDAGRLVGLLMRYHAGDIRSWRVVRVPTPAQEDLRHTHRELEAVKRDLTRSLNRMKGLLMGQGIWAGTRGAAPHDLRALRDWQGNPLATRLLVRLERDVEAVEALQARKRLLERERKAMLRNSPDPAIAMVRRLMRLKAIGPEGAWTFVMELFGWRHFANVREVGAIAGLTPTLSASGRSERELGMSKAGNRRVRAMCIEIAWSWLKNQPQSELSIWYNTRFGVGKRVRKIGIVALARKVLIALWKYLEFGELPAGAELKAT
jgi:transposase